MSNTSMDVGPHTNVGPHKRDDNRTRYKIDVGPHIAARLQRIAAARGYKVADLAKFCIERVLPEFEKRL